MLDIKAIITDGEVTLRKPTAGIRNRAMMKAETKDGIKNTVMMVELLPLCVKAHPWGITPIKQSLDNLSCEDYDLLIDKLRELMEPNEELKKKLNLELNQPEEPKDGQ